MKIFGFEIKKTKKTTPQPLSTIFALVNDITKLWQVKDDRKSIYDDIDRMYDEDDYVAEALDVLLSDIFALKSFYEPIIHVECKDENLLKKILKIKEKSKLEQQVRNIGYNFLKYGNTFCELIISPNGKLVDFLLIPQTWSMYRNVDTHGRLRNGKPGQKKPGVCAYDQRDETGRVLAEFLAYQIIHFRNVPYDTKGYGIPFLKSARRNWLRLQQLEDSMVRARIIRAFLKLIHHVPVPDEPTLEQIEKHIEQYKRSIAKQAYHSLASELVEKSYISNPVNESTDFYMPTNSTMKGKIDAIDPSNAQLQNISDVEYFQNRLFARLKVPKARLANERDVNAKATLVEQNTAYAATITGFQIDLLAGFVEFINRALFFEGVDIDKVEYKLVLPSPFVKNEFDRARIENLEATVAQRYVQTKILSRDTARKIYLEMDDQKSSEEEEKIEREIEKFPSQTGTGIFASQIKTDEEVLKELYQLKKEIEKKNGNGNRLIYR
ncbi:MAG TPA: hypothetical protein ENI52_03950 [Thermoplasmata archaeon]|nr:hypothetical protein [Thermoplasmata archaeon]